MIENSRTICFTGHRKVRNIDSIKILIREEVEKSICQGYNTFLFGGAIGFDIISAREVLNLKKAYKNIELIAIIPCKNQSEKWTSEEKEEYQKVVQQCKQEIILNEISSRNCYKNRNQYMIEHCSKVIAYWNGAYRSGTAQTVRMAQKNNLVTVNLFALM